MAKKQANKSAAKKAAPAKKAAQASADNGGGTPAKPRILGLRRNFMEGHSLLKLSLVNGFVLAAASATALESTMIGNADWFDREPAEKDSSIKQLVPYVAVVRNGKLFSYARGGKGGEARLHAKRSIGLGGHIEEVRDAAVKIEGIFNPALYQELHEEIGVFTGDIESLVLIGTVNDDTTDVGSVHLGVVYVIELDGGDIHFEPNEADGITDHQWHSIDQLMSDDTVLAELDQGLETWSRMILSAVLDHCVHVGANVSEDAVNTEHVNDLKPTPGPGGVAGSAQPAAAPKRGLKDDSKPDACTDFLMTELTDEVNRLRKVGSNKAVRDVCAHFGMTEVDKIPDRYREDALTRLKAIA